MKQFIDIDQKTLKKLKTIAGFEGKSIDAVLKEAIKSYIDEYVASLTMEQREDLGLLHLMEDVDLSDTVDEDEFLDWLNSD